MLFCEKVWKRKSTSTANKGGGRNLYYCSAREESFCGLEPRGGAGDIYERFRYDLCLEYVDVMESGGVDRCAERDVLVVAMEGRQVRARRHPGSVVCGCRGDLCNGAADRAAAASVPEAALLAGGLLVLLVMMMVAATSTSLCD